MRTYSDYRARVSDVFSTVSQWPDVETVLDFVRDKPGAKLSLGDLMQLLSTEDPMRVLSATVILTGGPQPIMRPFFRVQASDGTMHDVDSISKPCLDGELPYTLEAKNEIISHVGERAFIAYQVADF